MLTAEQAAQYLGYETTGVLANIPVQPVQMVRPGLPGSQPKYDRYALDAWLDRLSGLSVPAGRLALAEGPQDVEEGYATWRAARAAG